MCVCVCVGGGGAEGVHGVWEQDKQGVGSPNASTSGAVASSSNLPSTLGEKTGTPSVQLGLQQCPMYSFHELLLHFRVMRVELCFWYSCMHNSGKEGIKSLQSVPKDVKVLFSRGERFAIKCLLIACLPSGSKRHLHFETIRLCESKCLQLFSPRETTWEAKRS